MPAPKSPPSKNSPQRSSEKRANDFTASSFDSSGSGDGGGNFSTKVRSVLLSRFWKKWASDAKSKAAMRQLQERHLLKNTKMRVLRQSLAVWALHTKEMTLSKRIGQRKLASCFRQWKRFDRENKLLNRRADDFALQASARRCINTWLSVVHASQKKMRAVQERANDIAEARRYRLRHLLSSVFSSIKAVVRREKEERRLEEESSRRKERISKLITSLTIGEAGGIGMGGGGGSGGGGKEAKKSATMEESASKLKQSTRGGAFSARGEPNLTAFAESKSSTARLPLSARSANSVFAAGSKSAASSSQAATRKKAEEKKKTGSSGGAAKKVSTYNHNGNHSKEDDEPPPPAYDAGPTSLAASAKSTTTTPSSSSSYKKSTPSRLGMTAPSSASLSASSTLPAKSVPARKEESLGVALDGGENELVDGMAGLSLEERIRARKEKIALLQKQAVSRVQNRNKEHERLVKEKEQKEAEALVKLQEDHRAQLESAKAEAQKTKEQIGELKRKIKAAEKCYRNHLVISVGWKGFLALIEHTRLNWAKAVNYFDDSLLQATWIAFYGYCMMQKQERMRKEARQSSMALAHYRRKLVRSTWRRWILHRRMLRAKAVAVTGHFSRFTCSRRAFGAWRIALERSRRRQVQQLRAVQPRGNRCILRFFWARWMAFFQEALVEREVKNRTDLQWSRVQSWLA